MLDKGTHDKTTESGLPTSHNTKPPRQLTCSPFVRQYGIPKNEWAAFMPMGVPKKRYTAELRQAAVETMQREGPSYKEAARRFEVGDVAAWERIYIDRGAGRVPVSRATYCYHVKRQAAPDKYLEAKAAITAIHHENKGRYGHRHITADMRDRGFGLNHQTVRRLMKKLGPVCRVRIKKYHSYKAEVGKPAPDLLERSFEAEKPNQKWVTAVTEFHLFGQKLYLSPILDLCSRDIVSYALSDRPVLSMVTGMLNGAFAQIPEGTNLILLQQQARQGKPEGLTACAPQTASPFDCLILHVKLFGVTSGMKNGRRVIFLL